MNTNTAQDTQGAPAINIVFPETSAEKIASSLHRNGIVVGVVGGVSIFLIVVSLLVTTHMLAQDETAHTLCAYEFNRFEAQLETRTDSKLVLEALKFSGCNRKKEE